LSQAAATATGSPTPLAALALTMYEAAMEAGYGEKDFSAVFGWLAEQNRQ
jgi:3-hydroxyisobutyrate dehydrogenase-like beta-hydroxyacid dehydrogenase